MVPNPLLLQASPAVCFMKANMEQEGWHQEAQVQEGHSWKSETNPDED